MGISLPDPLPTHLGLLGPHWFRIMSSRGHPKRILLHKEKEAASTAYKKYHGASKMSKDVMAFEFNQHRLKHQRSNWLKPFLMDEEHVGEVIEHPPRKSTEVQTTTCIQCRHAFLNKEIPKGHHGCTACGQIYSPEQWTTGTNTALQRIQLPKINLRHMP